MVRAPARQFTGLSGLPAGNRRCPHLTLSFHQTKNLVGIRRGFLFGGRGWIRTTEVSDNRFTVCPLWPLGNSPRYLVKYSRYHMIPRIHGAGDGTRTRNLLITNQLLCQLSYTSISSDFYNIAYQKRFVNSFFKLFQKVFLAAYCRKTLKNLR